MSLLDYFSGQQSWSDYVSNRDLKRGFETALIRAGDRLAFGLDRSSYEHAMSQGLGALSTKMSDAVGELRYAIEDVANGIDSLRADFNIMMGDVVWQLEMQNSALQSILETLQQPLDTAARELRRRAIEAYGNGWYEEALADFLEAEKKNYQDFTVHRSVANIYFYHLPDLPNALEYFRKAAKYARPRDTQQAAEACYFAALASGLQQQLPQARGYAEEAVELNPEFAEAWYLLAGFRALLGEGDTAVASLQPALRGDPRYHERALADPIFGTIRSHMGPFLDGLVEKARADAKSYLSRLEQWRRDHVITDIETPAEVASILEDISVRMSGARTYADWTGLSSVFAGALARLDEHGSPSRYRVTDLNGGNFDFDCVAFSDSGNRCGAIGCSDPLLVAKVWDIASGQECSNFARDDGNHSFGAEAAAFSPDLRRAAVARFRGIVEVWDLDGSGRIHSLRGHQYNANSVCFHPSQSLLASGGPDKTIVIWEIPEGRKCLVLREPEDVTQLLFSPDGQILASVVFGKGVTLWNWRVGEPIAGPFAEGAAALAFDSGGTRLATGTHYGKVLIWAVPSGQLTATLQEKEASRVMSLTFHPNGKLLAAAYERDASQLWDIERAQTVATLPAARKIAFHPAGTSIATVNRTGVVRLWSKCVLSQSEHAASLEKAARVRQKITSSDPAQELQRGRRAAQCEVCGDRLGFLDRIGSSSRCKLHR